MSDQLLSAFGISENDMKDAEGKPLAGTPRQKFLMDKLGPVLFKVYLMRSFALRIERDAADLLDMVKDDQSPNAVILHNEVSVIRANAQAALDNTAKLGGTLSYAWRPSGKRSGGGLSKAAKAIGEGSVVDIKEAALKEVYQDVISEEESKDMTVFKDTGTRVWCRTKSGDKVHVPKKDLVAK